LTRGRLGDASEPQHVARFLQQRVGIERLGHVQIGADLQPFLAIELLALGGQQDDVRVGEPQRLLGAAAHVEAAQLGHHDVEEHEVRSARLDGGEGLLAVGRRHQFDALVLWSPRFAFVAEISAKVALQAFGQTFCAVGLRLQLEGPGPWKAQGTASVSLLFFDVELDAGPVVWGEGTSLPAAPVSPQELVHAALSDPGAWLGRLPAGGEEAVRLVPAGEEERRLVHPLGSFEARQKAVPLETAIDRVGRHPASERRVNLGQPELGGVPVAAVSETTDLFAPGEFLDLSEDEKLSMPGFRELPSGLRLAPGAGRAHGSPLAAESSWHTVYPGQDLQPPAPVPLFLPRQLRATALALAPATRAMTASNPYLATPEPEVPA